MKKQIINCETGEIETFDYTPEELAQIENSVKEQDKLRIEKETIEIAKEAQRQALLNKLGITAEEAQLLLS